MNIIGNLTSWIGYEPSYLDNDLVKTLQNGLESESHIDSIEVLPAKLYNKDRSRLLKDAGRTLERSRAAEKTADISRKLREDSHPDRKNTNPFSLPRMRNAATVYATLGYASKFAEMVCMYAKAMRIFADEDPEAVIRNDLSSLDGLVGMYTARRNMTKGSGKHARKLKERKKKVRKLKAAGKLKPGDRWPRKRKGNYQAPQEHIRAALNLLYMRAETCAQLGYTDMVEKDYEKAMHLVEKRLNGFEQKNQYATSFLKLLE